MVQALPELQLLNSIQSYGVRDIIMCDSKGAIYEGRQEGMNNVKAASSKIYESG